VFLRFGSSLSDGITGKMISAVWGPVGALPGHLDRYEWPTSNVAQDRSEGGPPPRRAAVAIEYRYIGVGAVAPDTGPRHLEGAASSMRRHGLAARHTQSQHS